jgi:hypothetical protein
MLLVGSFNYYGQLVSNNSIIFLNGSQQLGSQTYQTGDSLQIIYNGDTVTPHPSTLTTFDITGTEVIWINDIAQPVTWYNNNYDQGKQDFVSTWTNATPPGTIFDGGSMQFTAPVDMYSTTTSYDKYLVFPKRDILQ